MHPLISFTELKKLSDVDLFRIVCREGDTPNSVKSLILIKRNYEELAKRWLWEYASRKGIKPCSDTDWSDRFSDTIDEMWKERHKVLYAMDIGVSFASILRRRLICNFIEDYNKEKRNRNKLGRYSIHMIIEGNECYEIEDDTQIEDTLLYKFKDILSNVEYLVMHLRFNLGMSISQTARAANLSQSRVTSATNRAKNKIELYSSKTGAS